LSLGFWAPRCLPETPQDHPRLSDSLKGLTAWAVLFYSCWGLSKDRMTSWRRVQRAGRGEQAGGTLPATAAPCGVWQRGAHFSPAVQGFGGRPTFVPSPQRSGSHCAQAPAWTALQCRLSAWPKAPRNQGHWGRAQCPRDSEVTSRELARARPFLCREGVYGQARPAVLTPSCAQRSM